MKVTENIQRYLAMHTHPDLAALYNPGMEVQVMVRPDGGHPTEGGKSYSDGINTWFNFRIPKNARTTPEFRDWELKWPLQEHCLAIGMTGWNFAERKSMHVAYDFDAICGTSHQGTGVTQEELDRVRDAACAIPWVETRKSTGGGGLHLRVHLGKGVPTANHTEHAALGRAILGMMSAEAGFDFADKVDICGGNMWVWHRKMTPENSGLTLVKPRERDLNDVPENWRDHIDVVSRKRRKVRVPGLNDSAQDKLASLADTTKSAPLDDTHRKLMDWLTENRWTCVWEADHGMMRTHTAGLAEAHAALDYLGFFKTLATGRDKSDYNCFAFPKPDGGWRVVRYGQGTLEADTWVQDADWTYCYLNQRPDLKTAALAKGGVADEDGGFVFPSLMTAAEVAKILGAKVDVNGALAGRQTKLRSAKDGSGLVVEVKREKDDTDTDIAGYIAKKGTLKKVVNASLPTYTQAASFDAKIRYLLTPAKEPGGWVLSLHDDWFAQPKDNIISVLMNNGMSAADAKATTGQIVEDGWILSSIPFQAEYPGGRRWNKDAAQFRFKPVEEDDCPHPHWDMILNHCGKGINDAVTLNDWCVENAVTTGATYLRYWLSSMIQYPYEPLPYLFFFSEPYQNCGKSSFHEAINLLMTKGVMRADQALQSQGNFNGELAGAILCVVEETDLSKAGSRVYEKMKDWVTGRQISLHTKGLTPYLIANMTHWIQCSNLQRACPVFEGDTRVSMVQVYPFDVGQEIPWPRLKMKLEEEAPAFLRTILDTNIPPSNGRLRIPVIDTEDKARAIEFTRDELQTFIAEKCHYIPGARILFSDFYDRFMETLGVSEKVKWTKNKVSASLPPKYPKGHGAHNNIFIGNISFDNLQPNPGAKPLIRAGKKLLSVDEIQAS
jgi:hypothetical protein